MKIRNTFLDGKMNKDLDERVLPKNQYLHAENIRVSNSEGSDVAAIENSLSNKRLTTVSIGSNPFTVGFYADEFQDKIYWFVVTDTGSYVLEWETETDTLSLVLQDTRVGDANVLNFNQDYLITGVSLIIDSVDTDRRLLCWTDDLNPPRMINIERAKTYAINGFDDEDISLIKSPPRYAPDTSFTYTSSTLENNLEDKPIAIAYRYKFLDGEFSALSSFSNYMFSPSDFDLDYQTLENLGMVNVFNAIDIDFNTGSDIVTDIELVFKQPNSNTLYLIESFNKADEGWSDNTTETFRFSNSKIYRILPEDELFRSYDNVPIKAKALEIIGNRIVFGNYVEGYDLVDSLGSDINMDFTLAINSYNLVGEELTTTYNTVNIADDEMDIDLTGVDLNTGYRLSIYVELEEQTYMDGEYSKLFTFILNDDFADASALAADTDFIQFVEDIMTAQFEANYTATPPTDGTFDSSTGFVITGSTATSIQIQCPVITYEIDNGIDPITYEDSEWDYNTATSYATISEQSTAASLKTNRSYEVGVIYMDAQGRKTTVQTCATNDIYIPQSDSINQNKLQVTITNNPPAFADRYKFVIKQNKGDYFNIYGVKYHEDGIYAWVKIEGENKNKVKEGDILIVKSDLSGYVPEIIKVKVIEIVTQEENFLGSGIQEAGVYMKIKPQGFDIQGDATSNAFYYDEYNAVRSGRPFVYMGNGSTLVGYYDSGAGQYQDYEILPASTVSIKFRNYESDGYNAVYEKDFIVQGTHANFEDWFNAEVGGLGASGSDFNYSFSRGADNQLLMWVEGVETGSEFERSKLSCQITVNLVDGLLVFETEAKDNDSDTFFETSETFDIIGGFHQGNVQNQTGIQDAISELSVYNCFVQGNGVESYRYKDTFNSNPISLDLRPSLVDQSGYKAIRRYADLTYSEPYNDSTSVNGLNEFNLYRANFKEDLDKTYGFIQRLHTRDTNLVVFQEDKISYILFGKDLLTNADGTANVTSVDYILGEQVTYQGEFGISLNPESFAEYGNWIYFTDSKRGVVLRLSNQGLTPISEYGMSDWFSDIFRTNQNGYKFGGFDPYFDQYTLSLSDDSESYTLTFDEDVTGWTSFHSFIPDAIIKLNNSLYTIKDGDLYIHNDNDNPNRNNYYGVDYPSKIDFVFNDAAHDVKVFKTLNLEGDASWGAEIETNLTDGTISSDEFIEKEGEWYAHTRRSEDTTDTSSLSTQGLGNLDSISLLELTMSAELNSSLSIGDSIYFLNGTVLDLIGVCTDIDRENKIITVDAVTNVPSGGDFIVAVKNGRVEGSSIRGYYMLVKLTYDNPARVELFAVCSEIFKSFD